MTEIDEIIERIRGLAACQVFPPRGTPCIRSQDRLPDELLHFYRACGGVRLFDDAVYPIRIVGPEELVRSNPEIVGRECPDDITDAWYIVARAGLEVISIDCHPDRLGRCYDSFWDSHGVAGSCAVVALSFGEFLQRLLSAQGRQLFWLADGGPGHGDAYDDR